MNYLDYITGILNEAVKASFPCENTRILGVAQAVRVEVQSTTQGVQKAKIVPGVYVGNGDVEYSGFDDRYQLCSYHKAINMSSRRVPGSGYGHEQSRIALTHNMSLVICADVDRMGKDAGQIALDIQFKFPDLLKANRLPEGFYSVAFNVTGMTLNAEQVFREEFQNENYFLGPQHALLKVNYAIESVLNKRCFPANCEPQELQTC